MGRITIDNGLPWTTCSAGPWHNFMLFNIDNIDLYGRKTWAYSYIIAVFCGTNMVFKMTLYNIYALFVEHIWALWYTHVGNG